MMSMSEQNMINDVRNAKSWLDSEFTTFEQLAERLRAIETAFQARSGEFASVPLERPTSMQSAIDNAADEPGNGVLNEIRRARTA
jgi:hypothetical protein